MSLVALIADPHFGASNSNNLILAYQEQFFESLVPELVSSCVSDLIILGDLYDSRKIINFKTLKKTFQFFTENLLKSGLTVHIIVGNHDSYNKNSLEINAVRELLSWTPFNIYDKPQEIIIDGTQFLMVPWICDANKEECLYMIDNSEATVCCGHFDLSGFYMIKNVLNQHGLASNLFKKFKRTYSGHFHIPGNSNNICMVGSPYELNWNDHGDKKRTILYDTKTNKESYLINPVTIHEKIFFEPGYTLNKSYENKIVKLYASRNQNSYDLDMFLQELNAHNPYSVTVVENVDFETIDDNQSYVMKDTLDFLQEYIGESDHKDSEKFELNALMHQLYQSAKEVK